MKYNYILVLTAWNACFLDMSKVQIYIIRCFEFWHEFFLLSGIRWQHNWFGHHFLIWTKFNGDSVAVSKWYVLATIYLHIANVLPANNQLSKLHERQNFSISNQVILLLSYDLVEIWLILSNSAQQLGVQFWCFIYWSQKSNSTSAASLGRLQILRPSSTPHICSLGEKKCLCSNSRTGGINVVFRPYW